MSVGWLVLTALLAAAVVLVVGGPAREQVPRLRDATAEPSAGWRFSFRGRRRRADATAAAVLETCEVLAAELRAGRPPGAALATASEQWPPLGPVAEAFGLGADVPAALRRLAGSRRGAHDLRLLAGAWEVAHQSGAGLADALDRTARGIRTRRRTRRLVESELASARATSRLVALLPVAVLLTGSGAGGDPWAFLLGTPVGLGCLVAGLSLIAAGLVWIESIADRAAPS